MSKPYAQTFYASDAWRRCRKAYISNRVSLDGGMCEECGECPGEELHHVQGISVGNIDNADVTLNHNNLKWLCRDCHFKAHRLLMANNFKKRRVSKILNDAGYYFDDDGEMQQAKTYIVYGSPASGKTSYVRSHKAEGDLVVDLDLIKQAISMGERAKQASNLLPVAFGIAEYLYSQIEAGAIDSRNKWIIATLPSREKRSALAERLGAELIYIDATHAECIERVRKDPDRKDKLFEMSLVDDWWERYEV